MRVQVTGVGFDAVTMEQTISWIKATVEEKMDARFICTGNLDHLVLLDRDREFRSVYGDADLVLADGAPVVWLSRLSARRNCPPLPERVAGSDLFWEVARLSHEHDISLFFLGGVPGSVENAANVVRARYANAKIAGVYCPPFETFSSEEEQEKILNLVREAKPDVLLVGLGAPKQEKWIWANRELLQVPVSIGVGGSFEMACGHVQRAPVWMRRNGLEWLFRFVQEPGRLYKRYFVNDVPFLIKATLSSLRNRGIA
jgi:N-acetylglucosaminyldiphosphoundecaprenol N-acetyl-beta-D-mannosaminyltransferase